MSSPLAYLVFGLALLLAVVLPTALRRVALSAPAVLVAAGALIAWIPMPPMLHRHPSAYPVLVTHLSEVTVLVALVGVGLALDRPLSLRSRSSLRAWRSTWRLLLLAMPVCIAAMAGLGVALGLPLSVALLVGAALAPTDPVLAADVQVDGPTTEAAEEVDESDEVRFALTSEAGFNDALAFPFVVAAMTLAAGPMSAADWGLWLAWDVLGRVALGAATGWVCGWLLARVAFRSGVKSLRLAEQGEPLLAFALLGVTYGLAELVHGWGFLAVFIAAMTVRSYERAHGYHELMHQMVERMEVLLTLLLLLLLGISLKNGLLGSLTWRGAVLGLALVLVIRPVVAWVCLGKDADEDVEEDGRLGPRERIVTAFFGVRGIGSVFYVAYALGHEQFPLAGEVWSTVAFTIVLSVAVHGILATPALRWLESRRRPARPRSRRRRRGATAQGTGG